MSQAGGVLARSVTLRDEEFRRVTFLAGDTPPAWAAKLITNPSAWESAPAPTPEGGPTPEDTPPAPETTEPADGPEPDAEPSEDLLGELPEPPKRGAGSGKEAWAAYAKSKGVQFADDASRDDIIAAIEAGE